MTKTIFPVAFLLLTLVSCNKIQNPKPYELKLKGSESMYETFLELKNDFEKQQDSIFITLEGGGSQTGLMAIKNREAEIGLSSFPFDLDATLGANHGVTEKVVAYDAIVLITNPANMLDSLSDELVRQIYSGEIYDWNQLTSRKGQILPIIRDKNSGTQKFFTEHFQIKKLAPAATVAATNAEIVAHVSGNAHGIGFIGFAYFTQSVNTIKLSADQKEFRAPTHRNLENGKYPLKRGLRIYFKEVRDPAIRGFLQYLKTKRAQSIIESFGLIPA